MFALQHFPAAYLPTFVVISCLAVPVVGEDLGPSFEQEIRPLLSRYCLECHSGDTTEADVDLGVLKTAGDAKRALKVWVKVRGMLRSRQMPPRDARQPTGREQQVLSEWVRSFLLAEARNRTGDPGPVVLRRLNNDEYTYTIRDLTGVATLSPAREFPVDGAAGEGFINTGAAQAMSPALVTKYYDAARRIADHAVLTPTGIRFSPLTTARDHTDELLARIQSFYRRYTEQSGRTAVNLQGIKFDTNQGGRLPIAPYITATLEARDAIRVGKKTLAQVAAERNINENYLTTLWNALARTRKESPFIAELSRCWRAAKPEAAPMLIAEIEAAQKALWKFNSIGHIGRNGGPKSWMEAVSPATARHELRQTLPAANEHGDVRFFLSSTVLFADGNNQNVVLERPRIEFPDKNGKPLHPPIELRDVRGLLPRVRGLIVTELPRTAEYLKEIADRHRSPQTKRPENGLNADLLESWAMLAGLGQIPSSEIAGHFTTRITNAQGYRSVNGWGRDATPSLLTNSANEPVKFLTLTVPARGVTVHPSPTLESVVHWSSPVDAAVRVECTVADADNVCGNGAAWRLEHHSAAGRQIIAKGTFDNGKKESFNSNEDIPVRRGDVVSLIVNARDRSHACDTTHIELRVIEQSGKKRRWDLAKDIVDDVLKGNPLPDSYGNQKVWHFCAQPDQPSDGDRRNVVPGSALAAWRAAVVTEKPQEEVARLASQVQTVLTASSLEKLTEADRELRQRMLDLKGPLRWIVAAQRLPSDVADEYGWPTDQFGQEIAGSRLPASDVSIGAPGVLELRLPGELVAGGQFTTAARLPADATGAVQVGLHTSKPARPRLSFTQPIVTSESARPRVERAAAEFRELFPEALCYARIVPVDEVVTLRLFYREDDHLKKLMLGERETAELDGLWDELFFVAKEPLKLAVSFEQISEFATQDRPDLVKAFEPMREPINRRAAAFRQRLRQSEPVHVAGLLELADRAWRRPLTEREQNDLRALHAALRKAGVEHEKAVKLTLARILASPNFLYRREQAGSEAKPVHVSHHEMATRLSYFLWSSQPGEHLRNTADRGELQSEQALLAETRRMLNDARVRRLAVQFACQWLHLRNFDQNADKNEKLFPEFANLRADMYEETVRFFEHMFRENGSMLDLLTADHTFLNERLAKHYGIGGVAGNEWKRVDGLGRHQRGGVLGMATFLASQSGASRTSPILRGNWVSETLLGEKLPKPPANVPQLPQQVPEGLTARQLIERHSSVPACAKCHARIDPYGFALEQFDALGRVRKPQVDTRSKLIDGRKIEGVNGLRKYLATDRRDDVARQFCRKLLGFALGREVQLSDEVLLDEMQRKLQADGYRFHTAVETIVLSPQFRMIRGRTYRDE